MRRKVPNPNGRPKGIPNKITMPIRQAITLFIQDNLADVQHYYSQLEPWQKLMFLERIMRYAVAPLQSLDITAVNRHEISNLSDADLARLARHMTAQLTNSSPILLNENNNTDEQR